MGRPARSNAGERNTALSPLERRSRESNLAWGARAVAEMQTGDATKWSYIVLLGGNDTTAFRLRLAQSHLRGDMLPSYWSDVLMVELVDASVVGALAWHVPLTQPGPPEFPPRSNGVVRRPLKDFARVDRYPNIAVIALPTPQESVLARIRMFMEHRGTLDALEHVLRWQGFCWGVARAPNPLHENYGIPSACMLEIACAAEQFDLTPGVEARASTPEAIWAAAGHWHEYYERTQDGLRPMGRFTTRHRYPIFHPDNEAGDRTTLRG
ncbi:MAG: hypothetical protein V4864_18025 [Pseudomonadota bacterium]